MLILHISDLHETSKEESLTNIWSSVKPKVSKILFDFIIVSGDLSNDGVKYNTIKNFFNNTLKRHLKKRDKSRIIFVPGNHDVDWSSMKDVCKRINQKHLKSNNLPKKIFKELKETPFSTNYRYEINKSGEIKYYRIINKYYNNRFRNIQKFINDFYIDVPIRNTRSYKPFNLTTVKKGKDWSAHIFKEDKVAFFGFNSCYRNDEYWNGARICYDSIDNASRYAENFAQDCTLIAVWHHGLHGTEYRPDCISISEIGKLFNSGFKIGLHGHIHSAKVRSINDFLDDRFLLISTGSLGASHHDRPPSTGNQFSIIKLSPGYAKIDTYDRLENNDQLRNIITKYHFFPNHTESLKYPDAKEHVRTYKVQDDGITDVNIRINHLSNPSGATIAFLTPPYCNYEFDDKADTKREKITVNKEEIDNKRIRFFYTSENDQHKRINWGYRFSNGIALNNKDLIMRKKSIFFPSLNDSQEGWPYTVRILSDKLTINLQYPNGNYIVENSIGAYVDKEIYKHGIIDFIKDDKEANRCKVNYDKNKSIMSLVIKYPKRNYRYAISYKLTKEGKLLNSAHKSIADTISRLCRNTFFTPKSYCNSISKVLTYRLFKIFDGLFKDACFVGLLWNEDNKLLLPTFGCFPCRFWSLSFEYGEGVAGHCFRFDKISCWRSMQQSIIIKKNKNRKNLQNLKNWIICVPILINKNGPSIGVFSIEANTNNDSNTQRVISLINGARNNNKDSLDKLNKLESDLNSTFWKTILKLDLLKEEKYAKQVAIDALNQLKNSV